MAASGRLEENEYQLGEHFVEFIVHSVEWSLSLIEG